MRKNTMKPIDWATFAELKGDDKRSENEILEHEKDKQKKKRIMGETDDSDGINESILKQIIESMIVNEMKAMTREQKIHHDK